MADEASDPQGRSGAVRASLDAFDDQHREAVFRVLGRDRVNDTQVRLVPASGDDRAVRPIRTPKLDRADRLPSARTSWKCGTAPTYIEIRAGKFAA
jgi:hypothetical protein